MCLGGVTSSGFDLSDIAAATEKFKSETKDILKLDKSAINMNSDNFLEMKKREDEAMERLLKEQAGYAIGVES